MNTNQRGPQEWWETLSPGERRLICTVMEVLRGAKRSQISDIAQAARKWEQGIGFFIKVRLMSGRRRGRRETRNGERGARNPGTEPTSTGTNQGGVQR